jgi:hypothetical protein
MTAKGAGLRSALALAALPACAALPPPSPFEDRGGEALERAVFLLFGEREFEAASDFGTADEAPVGGVELVWRRRDQHLGLELGLQHSYDEGDLPSSGEIEAEVTDLCLGLRYRFRDLGIVRPYAAAGAAVLYARTETRALGFPPDEDDEWSGALYARAGAWAPLGDDLRLGLDARCVTEEWLHAGELDLDHVQLAATLGFGF